MHGNYVDDEGKEIECDIEFSDSTCYCKDTTVQVQVYDEHYGYVWKDSSYTWCHYDDVAEHFQRGIATVNCAENVHCAQEVWSEFDHCGQGFISRKFKLWQGCAPGGDASHAVDTIYRHQRIWVGNECELQKEMFDVPQDVTVYACGIEYDPDGSGQVVGDAGPAETGYPAYTFDDDCRIVGIAHEDKVFKVVGGDAACHKIIRTFYFADWCGGKPTDPLWWKNRALVTDTCVQKILVIDTLPPVCEILCDGTPEEGDGSATSPAVYAANGGCYLDLSGTIDVTDACGVLHVRGQLKDLKNQDALGLTVVDVTGEMETVPWSLTDVAPGAYKLQIVVTDECQNEAYCEKYITVVAGKKPSAICVTSITAQLTGMDLDQDGAIDTAMALVWAKEFNASSMAPCGGVDSLLEFRIELIDGLGDDMWEDDRPT